MWRVQGRDLQQNPYHPLPAFTLSRWGGGRRGNRADGREGGQRRGQAGAAHCRGRCRGWQRGRAGGRTPLGGSPPQPLSASSAAHLARHASTCTTLRSYIPQHSHAADTEPAHMLPHTAGLQSYGAGSVVQPSYDELRLHSAACELVSCRRSWCCSGCSGSGGAPLLRVFSYLILNTSGRGRRSH